MSVRRLRPPGVVTGATVAVAVVVIVIVCAHPPPGAAVALAPQAAGSGRSGGPPPVSYQPPVSGTIVDRFRAPPNPYAAGNRGLDYRTEPLSPVWAAADGEVVFAGQVGGTLHLTLRHADGLRSSYSFLATVTVVAGQRVNGGDTIGTSADLFHFGLRDEAGIYLDPEPFLAGRPVDLHVVLVPGGDDAGAPTASGGSSGHGTGRGTGSGTDHGKGSDVDRDERSAAAAVVRALPDDPLARIRLWARNAAESRADVHAGRVAAGMADWFVRGGDCTPKDVVAGAPAGRRILIEVGGIGSTSANAAVDRVDASTLGYASGDVMRFSYSGGRVPPVNGSTPSAEFESIAASTYDARASQQDLLEEARLLAELIGQVARSAPGTPIDLVAHSQGGIVARLALDDAATRQVLPAEVATLVTLGSPHQGADAAALVATVRTTPVGAAGLAEAARRFGLELDPASPAAAQLVATSPVIRHLSVTPVPAQVRFTSVGARGDLVVTANRTIVHATPVRNTVVPLVGGHAHDELPGSPMATREIALAVGGRPPTCRTMTEAAIDLVTAESLSWVESAPTGLIQ